MNWHLTFMQSKPAFNQVALVWLNSKQLMPKTTPRRTRPQRTRGLEGPLPANAQQWAKPSSRMGVGEGLWAACRICPARSPFPHDAWMVGYVSMDVMLSVGSPFQAQETCWGFEAPSNAQSGTLEVVDERPPLAIGKVTLTPSQEEPLEATHLQQHPCGL